MKTTLNKIRSHSPCVEGWGKLLKTLGKTQADDEPLSLITILDSNGLDDALWCLRSVNGHHKEIRLYSVWCARQVQHLMKDKRSLEAMDVAEKFALGEATKEELAASAASAARATSAASDAWYAAMNARDTSAASDASDAWRAARTASAASAASDASDAWSAAWSAATDAASAAMDAASAAAAQETKFRDLFGESE